MFAKLGAKMNAQKYISCAAAAVAPATAMKNG